MRRQVLAIGLVFSLGILFQYIIGSKLIIPIMGALLIVILKNNKMAILILVFVLGAMNITLHDFFREDNVFPVEDEVTITGVIYDTEFKKDKDCKIKIKTSENLRILINGYGEIENKNYIGHKITVKGKINLPKERRNPKGFSQEMYFKTLKLDYYVSANISNLKVGGVESRLFNRIGAIKKRFSDALEDNMSDSNKAIVMAMIMGERDGLFEETYETF